MKKVRCHRFLQVSCTDDACCTSWRTVSSIEQKEEAKGNEAHVAMIKGYREKIEGVNSPRIPEDILEVLDKHLIPSAASGKLKVFYHRMYVHCPFMTCIQTPTSVPGWAIIATLPSRSPSFTSPNPRLAPLQLSVSTKDMDKGRGKQQQQHTRTGSSGHGGFEIFVDPTYDPDIEKTQKPHISTSSFEARALGAASPMSETKAVGKNQSTLVLDSRDDA